MSEEQTIESVEPVEETQDESGQSPFEDIADSLLGVDPIEETPEGEPEEIPDEAAVEEPTKYKVKVDGEEVEVELDELIRGYSYESHNTRKAQALAEKERELAAIEGLANKLKHDEKFAEHVFKYGKEEQPQEELDPIEQIKLEAKEAALKEVEKRFQTQTAQQQQIKIEQVKNKVSQDPLYNQVQEKLGAYIQSMPKSLQPQMFQTLDQDPNAYMEMYQRARATIEQPKAEKKVKAPVLVDSSQTQEVPQETKQVNSRKKMKAEMLRTGDLSNLQEYFKQEGGLVDQLIGE